MKLIEDIQNIECAKFQLILSTFNFGTNLSQKSGKYLIKLIFDINIEIEMFEISIVLNFNKF